MRVSIAKAQGSTPRPTGTLMLVTENHCAGSIGGGHLELKALTLAREFIARNHHKQSSGRWPDGADPGVALIKHFSLGPSLGQCCGGAVDLLFEVVKPSMIATWPEDARRFTLALFGAGHVGRAIVDVLSLLPCQLIWIDEREHEFPSAATTNSSIDVRCVDSPSAEVKTLPRGCFVIVTTHRHDLDFELCEAALNRNDLPFVGLIGSATKKARCLKHLEQKNVATRQRLVCPMGLRSIHGKEPAVIAVSVAAQLLELSSIIGPGDPN